MTRIVLNGEPAELAEPVTVIAAIEAAGAPLDARGVAVAVEGEVLPRGEWERTELCEGQHVEVLQAVQGG